MMITKQYPTRRQNGRFLLAVVPVFALLAFFALRPVAAQEPVVPATPPDAANGLIIYEARCANCHGPQGKGDGPLAANLPMPPRAFTDPAFRATAVPTSFYDLIFNGNLAAGMPGFGPGANTRAPLSEAEIWDTIAAVLTLATPPDSLVQGEALYAANCQACHGAAGLGDGPDATAPLPSLADTAYWFTRSNEQVVASLTPGAIEGHEYELDAGQLTAVADYMRTFSYQIAPVPVAAEVISGGTISGMVSNGSNGSAVGNATVLLRAFSTSIEEMLVITQTTGTDGMFQFTLGPVPAGWIYLVTASHEGLNFSSDVGQLSATTPAIELPVTVYDQSTDPSVIRIAQVHVVFDFLSPQILQVTQLYVYENLGNTVFVGEAGRAEQGVTRIALPQNAQNISFQRAFSAMEGFIPATEVIPLPDGFADTVPLRPGRSSASLVASYTLPYNNGAELSHLIPYAASSVTVILPDVGVRLVNDGTWTEQTQQTMGGTFRSYVQRNLPANSSLTLALEGTPQVSSTAGTTAVAQPLSQTTELIIAGVALLAAVGGAVFVLRRRAMPQEEEEEEEDEQEEEVVETVNGRTADELIQIIAALDDAYAQGELDEAAYRAERARLKADLQAIWQ